MPLEADLVDDRDFEDVAADDKSASSSSPNDLVRSSTLMLLPQFSNLGGAEKLASSVDRIFEMVLKSQKSAVNVVSSSVDSINANEAHSFFRLSSLRLIIRRSVSLVSLSCCRRESMTRCCSRNSSSRSRVIVVVVVVDGFVSVFPMSEVDVSALDGKIKQIHTDSLNDIFY